MYKNAITNKDWTDYLNQHDQKSILRFITCGSVDDGKSTLIGRILYESQLIYDDQLQALASDSKKFGTTEEELDLALLMDGLLAEREQGITIDVAYRYFSTDKRKFIVADTPGHEQYTRNMATGASTAQAAVVLVDARKGVITQTRRHSYIVSTLGVKHIILAVNKMDLMHYDEAVYQAITNDYLAFAKALDVKTICTIPISALKGANITHTSGHMPWYKGPSLMQYLETIPCADELQTKAFRMPVQLVQRPDQDFRGFSGRIASGTVKPGDAVLVLPGNQKTRIASIVSFDGEKQQAISGESITLTLSDEVDVSRGCLLAAAEAPCEVSDRFSCRMVWMHETPMRSGRQYLFKSNTITALCTPGKPKYRVDINTMDHLAVNEFNLNDIGDCDLFLDRPIAFEAYECNRELGGFILIDKLSHATVGAGFIQSSLALSRENPSEIILVTKEQRAAIKDQKPVVLWFTGLSGAGKSTIANQLEYELNARGKHSMLLDGDYVRHVLNRDLGFGESDRAENIRRMSELAKLMTDAGLITLVSIISPYQADRDLARERIGTDQFLEIFVEVPLDVAEARDVKGLYKKAREGIITNFTGISSPYEAPKAPDLRIDTSCLSVRQSVDKVLALLKERGVINGC